LYGGPNGEVFRDFKIMPPSLLEGDYSAACRIAVECIVRPLKSAHSRIITAVCKKVGTRSKWIDVTKHVTIVTLA